MVLRAPRMAVRTSSSPLKWLKYLISIPTAVGARMAARDWIAARRCGFFPRSMIW